MTQQNIGQMCTQSPCRKDLNVLKFQTIPARSATSSRQSNQTVFSKSLVIPWLHVLGVSLIPSKSKADVVTRVSRRRRMSTVECVCVWRQMLFHLLQSCGATPPITRARPSAWAPRPNPLHFKRTTHYLQQQSVSPSPSSGFSSDCFWV